MKIKHLRALILLVISISVVIGVWIYRSPQIRLDLPKTQVIEDDVNFLSCMEIVTEGVYGKNTIEEQKFTSLSDVHNNEDSSKFTVAVNESTLEIDGDISGYVRGKSIWTRISGGKGTLAAYLVNNTEDNIVQEFMTFYIHKETGHGTLNIGKFSTYATKSTIGYTNFIVCEPI